MVTCTFQKLRNTWILQLLKRNSASPTIQTRTTRIQSTKPKKHQPIMFNRWLRQLNKGPTPNARGVTSSQDPAKGEARDPSGGTHVLPEPYTYAHLDKGHARSPLLNISATQVPTSAHTGTLSDEPVTRQPKKNYPTLAWERKERERPKKKCGKFKFARAWPIPSRASPSQSVRQSHTFALSCLGTCFVLTEKKNDCCSAVGFARFEEDGGGRFVQGVSVLVCLNLGL
ncbi:hypothetical protein AG1IA_04209 [Rhizoctonia solani AG-1 IA]|uniref:Uncharacterized protein n=1 Tax=Thanatephorus cucumeris (strain AG1-IA) TaxID=983506 RepID=L8WUE7_THACA|nr:hypothetical protein AG1IA_04209 [Rhizoctonia solani AG-1 IA]